MKHMIGHVRNWDDYVLLENVMARRGIECSGEGSMVGISLVVEEAHIEDAVGIVRSMPWLEVELLTETIPINLE